jgi:inhibitor of growth protein 4
MVNVNDLKPEDKCSRFKNIHEMFEKAKVISDDKVSLASQTYEMVDKHIRKLDSELARLESEMKDKQVHLSASSTADETAGTSKGSKGRKKKDIGKNKTGVNPKSIFESKDPKKPVFDTRPSMLPLLASGTEVLDMPVDPNEPTYCICHQVSYGEMIGCDNNDCTIEWFHFGCVGLTTKPKGKWYCPKCMVDRKKK